ncbi:MAG: N-acyl-D-aspartate/D-glutamate deacylase [Actinomycetia bacterium]|nr:N-acyl-D-aspartate/D-glutamate deacylase [Actinomycetes bacterium]
MADVVIRGGMVIDGTGAPARRADVGITGGVISDIDDRVDGTRVLDASGHVVTPGFIDIHTHYDAQVFWDPGLTPSSFHGVTTVIAGNCGFSIAPVRPEHRDLLVRTLQHVEDMQPDTLFAGVPWEDFETFPQYLDAVESRGTVLNYGCYIGHTALRLWVMGDEGYEREATDDELRKMQGVIAEALDAGAAGFASSSSPTHSGAKGKPVPSRIADMREMRSLLEPMQQARWGVVALLPGETIKHSDVFELQRIAGRPLTWTALLTVKGYPWHEKIMEQNVAERAGGAQVWPQVSCRPLVFQMNLREPFTLNMRDSFKELMDTTEAERIAAYRDPAWRERAWKELGGGGFGMNWDSLKVAESATHPDLINRSIPDIAAEKGCTPLDVMLDISLSENLDTRFWSVLANNDEDAIAWLLPQDTVLLGLADSGAHVSQLCDACFATDLLGNWVRDRDVMPLEHAVHKLTGEPAGVYGMSDRGTLEVGKAADICAFDADTVAPGPLRRVRDFPANGERLTADEPIGVRHVLVNGTPIRVDGESVTSSKRPGTVLRG